MRDVGGQRVVIEGVWPEIDGGRFAIKRTIDETVRVEVDLFADGHDAVSGVLLFRPESDPNWQEVPLTSIGNDRWQAEFPVTQMGIYRYTIRGWVDHFKSWQYDLEKRFAAEQDVTIDLLIGAEMVEAAAQRAGEGDALKLNNFAQVLRSPQKFDPTEVETQSLSEELAELMWKWGDRPFPTTYEPELEVVVDRERARFSAWYEMFPRSCGSEGRHGTFKDCEARLPYISEMGFDVLYLPPIHPIGTTFRKGKNNSTICNPDDVGVPWGIGSPDGGHKAIHPDLGSLDDFRHLVSVAQQQGIEIALDFAIQCSPDHPYVKQHPDWFRQRPDGTIQYAENPPKKYQDIYPINFETADWQNLWQELKSILDFWIDQGVKIFRVDNPHTKSFFFWEWAIADIKKRHPEVIFLAEAFTRPKVMYRLAKLGFTQSYTYFTWRNNKWEMMEYLTELTRTAVYEFFRPNFWPNTPDILHAVLQQGGRPAFAMRLVLAATLTANYGIYGPAFELCENQPLKPGSEEYWNSEKYQIRQWDLDDPISLKPTIARINQIRRHHPALQSNHSLQFHHVDNDQIIAYTKQTDDGKDVLLMVVNMDPHNTQAGWLDLPLESLGLDPYHSYQLEDVLNGGEYEWFGGHNYVELNPEYIPGHIFWLKQPG